MRRPTAGCIAAFLITAASAGGPPQYTAEVTGPGIVINAMNEDGATVGWLVHESRTRGFVNGPNHPHELLPLPTGFTSSWAQGINDAGVIVGSVATGSPEFGRATAWYPDGNGGYDIVLLGELPGHTQSVAYAINNLGDIVGESINPGWQGGPTVWFNSPDGVKNLAILGAPGSPKDINDQRVLAGINGPLFDLDTLQPISLPDFNGVFTGAHIWGLNNFNEVAGSANIGGTLRCAANWTANDGWQVLGGIFNHSADVLAFDINDSQITVMQTAVTGWFTLRPAAHFPGAGLFPLDELVEGNWLFSPSWGVAVNNRNRIAAIGQNLDTGQSGVVILTPVESAAPLLDLTIVLGSALGGGLSELQNSDDAYLVVRSQFGFSAIEPNITEVRFGFTSPESTPATLAFTVESRLNSPNGLARVRIRNWTTNAFETVGQFATAMTDAVQTFGGLDAMNRVRSGDQRIEVSTKFTVFATFSALGFDTYLDRVQTTVN